MKIVGVVLWFVVVRQSHPPVWTRTVEGVRMGNNPFQMATVPGLDHAGLVLGVSRCTENVGWDMGPVE